MTGAGKGIGKEIALACAGAGADIVVGSRTVSEVEQVAEEVRKAGQRAEAWQLDVAEVSSIEAFVGKTVDTFGRIDVLVNNAGVNKVQPALDVTEADFDYIVDVNFKGTFFMSQMVAKAMIEGGIRGRIINISSQVGVVGGPLRAPYSGAEGCCLPTHQIVSRRMGTARDYGQLGRPNRHPYAAFRRGTEKPCVSQNGSRKCSDGADCRTGGNRGGGYLSRKRYSGYGHRTHTSCRWRMDCGLTA